MKYVYPAIFTDEGNGFSVEFPDIEGCYTDGDTFENALIMANDALCSRLYDYEVEGLPVPEPSKTFKTVEKQSVYFIACDTQHYYDFFNKHSVKKTVSMPAYLDNQAKAAGFSNYSHVLQEALKSKLFISKSINN